MLMLIFRIFCIILHVLEYQSGGSFSMLLLQLVIKALTIMLYNLRSLQSKEHVGVNV